MYCYAHHSAIFLSIGKTLEFGTEKKCVRELPSACEFLQPTNNYYELCFSNIPFQMYFIRQFKNNKRIKIKLP